MECRLCLHPEPRIPIWGNPESLALRIWRCCQLQVVKNDGLPDKICSSCESKLELHTQFKSICEESDRALRRKHNTDVNIKVEEIDMTFNNEDWRNEECSSSSSVLNIYNDNKRSTMKLNDFHINDQELSEVKGVINQNFNAADRKPSPLELSIYADKHNINDNNSQMEETHIEKCTEQNGNNLKKVYLTSSTRTKRFECDICSESFTFMNELNMHMKIHIEDKPHKCGICSKSFLLKSHLNTHIKIHTNGKPHKCMICSKAFGFKHDLNIHIKIHTGERPHKCDVCSRAFILKSGLNNHMKLHIGEKPFVCEVCSKAFVLRSILNEHMKVHTGEKPHICKICLKAFVLKSVLNRHMKIHSGEKPHKCEICSKGFISKHYAKIHMQFHTGGKPHQCEICSKAFVCKGGLKRHVKVHSGVNGCQTSHNMTDFTVQN
ncbi:uncharacterized protein LOC143921234 [Arctopsyche grandis]|uniref:uncharacterized protein LOC143921234 n=1 Tax=Arctopsyche grandis TaxID=121162 RepID=UPI00406D7BDC